jgi:cell division protein FtsI (penicillin-binding protein 3)
MPDVRYMTLRDALYVLESMNLKVTVQGRGKVLMQDVLPGASINKDQRITLLLN